MADISGALAQRAAFEAELHAREVKDYRALLEQAPTQTSRGVYWVHVRKPEPFEVPDAGDDVVVIVSALAHGLSLLPMRQIARRDGGLPIPADRIALSEMLRSGEVKLLGEAVPFAKAMPSIGLRLRVELEEANDRGRLVFGMDEGART